MSGSPNPWNNRKETASVLSDYDFVKQVKAFAGYSHPALEDPIMREILLPTLRADVEMHENYFPDEENLLQIPIYTIRGSNDDLVSTQDMKLWDKVTNLPIIHKEFLGGHMYLIEQKKDLIDYIQNVVVNSTL